MPDARVQIAGAPSGPLRGLTFAVKDVIDVAGTPTSAGNPDWRRTHPVPTRTAPCVQALLDSGATLVGKTVTDELCSSMSGINIHYGTPINPAAPRRLPGGSSSGSAAVVAGGLCDFALGTDTSGSVRLPAGYCGVFGYRPTHGRVSLDGVFPLAPSFDTVGLLARDAGVLRDAAACLRPGGSPPVQAFPTLLVALDAFSLVDPSVQGALMDVLMRLRGSVRAFREVQVHDGAPFTSLEAHGTLVGSEYHAAHQRWIDAVNPHFGPDVGARNAVGEPAPDEDRVAVARQVRTAMRERIAPLLPRGTFLALPTAFTVAPPRDTPLPRLVDIEVLSILHGCVASLCGLPQVSAPWGAVDGLPLGFSLVAGPDEDENLLAHTAILDAQLRR